MNLVIEPSNPPAADGTLITVTPESAGWSYVGFESLALAPGVAAERHTDGREVCIVVVSGSVDIRSDHAVWEAVGGRPNPFDGLPEVAYLPPGTSHDRDALPEESYLEETYFHRVDPARGFVVQRVYTDDRALDEALTVRDGDVVLVPRGYHPVGVPSGYRSYYLNVMAGPTRAWVFHNDPDHEWLMTPVGDRR